MKKLLILICLSLCMMLLVCSCGGNNDTDTSKDTTSDSVVNSDTNADTSDDSTTDTDSDKGSETTADSGINLNDGKYRVFVCDETGKGIGDIFVQFCKDNLCDFGSTDASGYLEIPSGEYHIALLVDESGTYADITYDESNYPEFEGDSKLITIILEKK